MSWRCRLLLQQRRPVDEHGKRLSNQSGGRSHQKALAVRRSIIGTPSDVHDGQRKQFTRWGCLYGIDSQFQAHHHQLIVGGHIEKLTAIRTPLWKLTSARRNLEPAARLWKRLYVDFVCADIV